MEPTRPLDAGAARLIRCVRPLSEQRDSLLKSRETAPSNYTSVSSGQLALVTFEWIRERSQFRPGSALPM